MSEIECAQLYSELFRRRHSTRQSHGIFALAKPLLKLMYNSGSADKWGFESPNLLSLIGEMSCTVHMYIPAVILFVLSAYI